MVSGNKSSIAPSKPSWDLFLVIEVFIFAFQRYSKYPFVPDCSHPSLHPPTYSCSVITGHNYSQRFVVVLFSIFSCSWKSLLFSFPFIQFLALKTSVQAQQNSLIWCLGISTQMRFFSSQSVFTKALYLWGRAGPESLGGEEGLDTTALHLFPCPPTLCILTPPEPQWNHFLQKQWPVALLWEHVAYIIMLCMCIITSQITL